MMRKHVLPKMSHLVQKMFTFDRSRSSFCERSSLWRGTLFLDGDLVLMVILTT